MADKKCNSSTNQNEKSNVYDGRTFLMKFERQLREIVLELETKHALLTKSQEELKEVLEAKKELQRQLETLTHTGEQQTTNYQNAKEKLENLEKELYQYSNRCKQHQVYLEIKKKENVSLKENCSQLKQENFNQSREIKELKSQVRCLSGIQNDHSKLYNLTDNAIQRIENLTIQEENKQKYMVADITKREESVIKFSKAVELIYTKYQNTKQELKNTQGELLTLTTATRTKENFNQNQEVGASTFVTDKLTPMHELREELRKAQEANSGLVLVIDNLTRQLITVHKEHLSAEQERANLTQKLMEKNREITNEIINTEKDLSKENMDTLKKEETAD